MSDACNSTRLSVRGVHMYNSGKMYMRKRERDRDRGGGGGGGGGEERER